MFYVFCVDSLKMGALLGDALYINILSYTEMKHKKYLFYDINSCIVIFQVWFLLAVNTRFVFSSNCGSNMAFIKAEISLCCF